MAIKDCDLVDLPKMADERGALSFIEGARHIPFDIKRVYYLYHVLDKATRGSHGHKKLEQLIVPVSGSFEITLDDGRNKRTFILDRPSVGLYVCPMIWRDIKNFSHDAVCLVLASEYYSEDDYYRNYEEFIRAVNANDNTIC